MSNLLETTSLNAEGGTELNLNKLEELFIIVVADNDYEMHYRYLLAYFLSLYPKMLNDKMKQKHLGMWKEVKKNIDLIKDAILRGKSKIPTSTIDSVHFWQIELTTDRQNINKQTPKDDGVPY